MPVGESGRARHHVDKKSDHENLFISEGPDKTVLRLRSGVPLTVKNVKAVAEFTLRAGETAAFILEDVNLCKEHPSNTGHYVSKAFKDTVNFWRRWVAHSTYSGRWREVMTRSALTLKLLTSEHYGTIVAAPTFGLPEVIGGERNWDYRYTWIRDSGFTIYGLLRMGFTGEALVCGYALLGSTRLLMKTEGDTQRRARQWATVFLVSVAAFMILVSLSTPFINESIKNLWFSWPNIILLSLLPLLSAGMLVLLWHDIRDLSDTGLSS